MGHDADGLIRRRSTTVRKVWMRLSVMRVYEGARRWAAVGVTGGVLSGGARVHYARLVENDRAWISGFNWIWAFGGLLGVSLAFVLRPNHSWARVWDPGGFVCLVWVIWFWLRRVRLLTSQGNLSRLYGYGYVSRGDLTPLVAFVSLGSLLVLFAYLLEWPGYGYGYSSGYGLLSLSLPYLQCSDVG